MEVINDDGEITWMKIRTPFNYNTDRASDETATYNDEPSMAQQSFKDDQDINVMMDRFGVTGQIQQVQNLPTSGDFTKGVTDYQSAMNIMAQARQEFMRQPAELRARFNNDPQLFMRFMENKENLDEIVRLGLATKRVEEIKPAIKPEEKPDNKPA